MSDTNQAQAILYPAEEKASSSQAAQTSRGTQAAKAAQATQAVQATKAGNSALQTPDVSPATPVAKPRTSKAPGAKPKPRSRSKNSRKSDVPKQVGDTNEGSLAADDATHHNKELGRRGEEAAVRFLYRHGYDIVERDWKCAFGEADIIAKDEDTLVFVEVKTRSDCEKGFPAEAVTKVRQERYEKIALAFLSQYDQTDITVRFDVISIVVVAPDRAVIRHHINAFAAD